jgi:RimJ/RimL family protein N-acetyltransferase
VSDRERADQSRRSHLNLIDSSRQLIELDPGAEVESDEQGLLLAGRHEHPVIANAAIRADDTLDGAAFVARAQDFFGKRGRGFSVFVRANEPEDEDLAGAAADAGMVNVFEMPEMVISERVEERELPPNAELRRLSSAEEVAAYWALTADAYVSLGFPPEVFSYYDNHEGLLTDNIAAFIAYLDGRPVSAAMTAVSRGVAGIYWVGTLEEARGKGLAWATTAAATNAGFELGADLASLQASPMGEPIYLKMGYEALFPYRLFMGAPPQ